MAEREDIDHILRHWPFDPSSVTVRKLWVNSRQVLQLRLDLGLLQMEIKYRPDGKRPHGSKTYLDYLKRQIKKSKKSSFSPRNNDQKSTANSYSSTIAASAGYISTNSTVRLKMPTIPCN